MQDVVNNVKMLSIHDCEQKISVRSVSSLFMYDMLESDRELEETKMNSKVIRICVMLFR